MTNTTTRSPHQIACDGVRTVWLPGTPVARDSFLAPTRRSMDGIVFTGTMSDVATHLHRQDFKQATARRHASLHMEEHIPSFVAHMDGVRTRPVAIPIAA